MPTGTRISINKESNLVFAQLHRARRALHNHVQSHMTKDETLRPSWLSIAAQHDAVIHAAIASAIDDVRKGDFIPSKFAAEVVAEVGYIGNMSRRTWEDAYEECAELDRAAINPLGKYSLSFFQTLVSLCGDIVNAARDGKFQKHACRLQRVAKAAARSDCGGAGAGAGACGTGFTLGDVARVTGG